jgi:D-serine deaminase-like pyridoxal phosphate-dependent protein
MDTLSDIPTPALLLDRTVLQRNVDRMAGRMRAGGVALRPHLKTAKSAEVARLATGGEPGPITVSTLAEAAYLGAHGFVDSLYAVGIVPAKLERAAGLLRDGIRLKLLTDDPGVAREIAALGRRLGVCFPVLVEIDCGGHRGGVDPESDALLETAAYLNDGVGARLAGVLTHAGQSYDCSSVDEIRDVAGRERAAVVRAAERVRASGTECPIVSAGSTPTALWAERFDGLTEMRPGNYVFFDLYQQGLGCCRQEDLALSVLATVIGHAPRFERLLIDAGALALSLDRSATRFDAVTGLGRVVAVDGSPIAPGLHVGRAHQEHGFVEAPGGVPLERLPIGTRVRVLPNHACATAAMYDRYHVTDGTPRLVAEWDRTNHW